MKSTSHSAQGILISKSGLGINEKNLIELSRYFFSCYSTDKIPDPEIAVELCSKKFGQSYAIEISLNLLEVISAMRESRKNTFQFNSSSCQKCKARLSDCERLFYSIIKSRRVGDLQTSYVNSMILCEGNDTSKLLNSIDKMNSRLLTFGII